MARRDLPARSSAVNVRRCDAPRSVQTAAWSRRVRRGLPRRYDGLRGDDDVRSRRGARAARGDQPHARLVALLVPGHVHLATPAAEAETRVDAFGDDDLLRLGRIAGVRCELVAAERVPCSDEDAEPAAVPIDDAPITVIFATRKFVPLRNAPL